MLYREIEVTYESVREWCQKFGQQYANQVRRKRSYLNDKWHLDEVVVTKLLKQQGFVPRVIVTEKLKSYEASPQQMLKSVEHRQHKGLNKPCENSHQPIRTRERRMKRFKSSGQVQRFLAAFGPIRDHFHPKQHQLSAGRG